MGDLKVLPYIPIQVCIPGAKQEQFEIEMRKSEPPYYYVYVFSKNFKTISF